MAKIKSIKPVIGMNKGWHTSDQKIVSGDYNGTAIKQKVGRVRDQYAVDAFNVSNKGHGKPPKALA